MTVTSAESANVTHRPPSIDPVWLDLHRESILDPDQVIIDPHHHLWARETQTYLARDCLADFASGHRIVASVFVECWSGYRTGGPEHLRCVGETAFVGGMAGPHKVGAHDCNFVGGIVSHTDLTAGARRIDEVLAAHAEAAHGRFRGIRHAVSWEGTGTIPMVRKTPPGLLVDARFQAGVAQLARHDLVFDAWLYQTQLAELIDLAHAAPGTCIALNHLGGPLAIGAYAGRRDELFAAWRQDMKALAACQNVVVKLGGLGMTTAGFAMHQGQRPPTSEAMAAAYRPHVETAIEMFGPQRCMFESNFPVDKISGSYAVLWNAFKRLSAGYSAVDKDALFWKTAADVYRLNAGLSS